MNLRKTLCCWKVGGGGGNHANHRAIRTKRPTYSTCNICYQSHVSGKRFVFIYRYVPKTEYQLQRPTQPRHLPSVFALLFIHRFDIFKHIRRHARYAMSRDYSNHIIISTHLPARNRHVIKIKRPTHPQSACPLFAVTDHVQRYHFPLIALRMRKDYNTQRSVSGWKITTGHRTAG